jgi:hypothetical protein
MTGDGKQTGRQSTQLGQVAEELREATAAALSWESWFAPTLDDCRLDAERLQQLGAAASEAAVHAVLIRSELALRTWRKLAAMTRHPARPPRPCPLCGQGTMQPVARAGRTVPFRGMQLEIPADFPIPTCDHCDGESLDTESAARLDEQLLSTWTGRTR